MRKRSVLVRAAAVGAVVGLSGLAPAGAAPRETITEAFRYALPNVPGKSTVGILVTYPPGGATPAHRHAPSAFIVGYVLSGAIRSQADDGEARVYHAGESWTEEPGAHHRISENASATEPARLLAVFVMNSGDTQLTTLDAH